MNDTIVWLLQAIANPDTGQMIFALVGEPFITTAEKCMVMAKEINSDMELTQVIFCSPVIEQGPSV